MVDAPSDCLRGNDIKSCGQISKGLADKKLVGILSGMKSPLPTGYHPGIYAAVVMAGSVRALGKIIKRRHSYINYRMKRGIGLQKPEATIVANELGIRLSKLTDNNLKSKEGNP
jgi:hypothetical protein